MEHNVKKQMISFIVYITIFFMPLTAILKPLNLSRDLIILISDFGVYFILSILLFIITKKYLKEEIHKLKDIGFLRLIIYIIIGFVLVMIGNVVGSQIKELLSGDMVSNNQAMVEASLTNNKFKIFSILSITLLGPFVEEVVFRQNLFVIGRYFKVNDIVILLISSILFGLMHVVFTFDFSSLPIYFFGGLMYGLIYLKSDCIYVPILSHVIVNLLPYII